MAFSDNSKLNVAFKKLVGKAQTDNLKEMANEAKASGVTVAASTIFGENLPLEPTINNLYDISNSPVTDLQAVEFLRLELVADPSSNGHAYFARLPSDYEANSSNEKVGEGFFVNQQQLVETAGKLQIVPPLFGLRYEAKPYSGGTSAKGSGSLIPPGDVRDWYFDYFNGVFFQQNLGSPAPTHLECLVYVGKFADEGLGAGGGTGLLADVVDAQSTTLPTGASVEIDSVTIENDFLVLFTNLDSGNNKIYKASGIGSSVSWEPQRLFLDNSEDPSEAETIRVRYGTVFKNVLFVFDGADFVSNDTVRFFDKTTKTNYWELSSLKSMALVAGTTNGEVFKLPLAGSENWIINYSLMRGANKKRTGQLILTSDGGTTSLTDTGASIGSCGVTFDSDIDGTDIRLLYTTDAGDDAELKFFAYRWSNLPGGPASLPAYDHDPAGVPASGPIGSVQYHGSDGFLAGGNNFKWGENSINLNGLKITAMEGPATLLDNQTVSQTIFSYNAAENKACLVEYLLERDGETQLGKLNIINNGSTVAMTGDYVSTDNLGVTFSAEISGSDVLVEYTSTNTGQDASFKFCRRRWS